MILQPIIKGCLGYERGLAHQVVLLETNFFSKHSYRRLGRIARHAPSLFTLGEKHARVGAKRRHFTDKKHFGMIGGVHDRPVERYATLWLVADAANREHLPVRPHFADDKLIFRNGTGFINGDDTRLSERLNRLQLLHECVALAHAPHAGGEYERDDDRQSFGDDRYGKRDNRCKDGDYFFSLDESEREKRDANHPDYCDDDSRKGADVRLERYLRINSGDFFGNRTNDGTHPRRRHNRLAVTDKDVRPLKYHISLLCNGQVFLAYDIGGLIDWLRFSSERGLVCLQTIRDNNARIRGNLLSFS